EGLRARAVGGVAPAVRRVCALPLRAAGALRGLGHRGGKLGLLHGDGVAQVVLDRRAGAHLLLEGLAPGALGLELGTGLGQLLAQAADLIGVRDRDWLGDYDRLRI